MNRIEMQENIKERVPFLIEHYKSDWKEFEKLRKEFIRDYPIKKINKLSLDEYVIGKGPGNKSFCYRIEYDLYNLGIISGTAFATKFGIWHGQYGQGSHKGYQFTKKFGTTLQDAFKSVKLSIIDLLNNYNNLDLLKNNKLSAMFKGKILFLYHPELFSNIYSDTHLRHFASELNLNVASKQELDLQKALMEYRASWPELVNKSPYLYSTLLYDLLGYPPKIKSQQAPLLTSAVNGATVHEGMPEDHPDKDTRKSGGSTDFEELNHNRKKVGDRGEAIVLELEKKRLNGAGKRGLANKVTQISQKNDSAGYDILSYEENGTEKQIEVKATSSKTFGNGFFLTSNELEKSKSLPNYHLFFVIHAMTDKPQIYFIKNPNLHDETEFTIRPTQYIVKYRNQEIKE